MTTALLAFVAAAAPGLLWCLVVYIDHRGYMRCLREMKARDEAEFAASLQRFERQYCLLQEAIRQNESQRGPS